MSFAGDTKAELCHINAGKKCCILAECYGILLFCHTFNDMEVRIITTGDSFSQRLPRLFQHAFGVEFDLLPPENSRGKRTFLIHDKNKLQRIFDAFGLESGAVLHINFGMLENECCKAAFLRGAFLAGGSLTDPEKRNHLEFITGHKSVAGEMHALMLEMELQPKDSLRNGSYLIYFKRSDAIADVLTKLGAVHAALDVMQIKVTKSMNSKINRKINCDTANADKIVDAAQMQIEAIRALDEKYGLFNLPEDLQESAMLRIANPEASLSELAALAFPPVSKSCMSHRMKKLLAYKEE